MGGSTGEAFVQSLSEREQVLEIVAEEAKGQIKLIAHVGCVSTAESQQLAASAKHVYKRQTKCGVSWLSSNHS